MPRLNDLLDFSDHPLMPPPSAQLFAEHLPAEWIQHCLTLSAHATVRRLNLGADGEVGMNLLAHSMLATIPDNSITLFDKLFYSADLLLTLSLLSRTVQKRSTPNA